MNERNKQHFPVDLFVMLYKVVLTFESVDKILQFEHSNESYSCNELLPSSYMSLLVHLVD